MDAEYWEFAVELDSLRRIGFIENCLRWLIRRDYVQQMGRSLPDREDMEPRAQRSLRFDEQSHFALSGEGFEYAWEVLHTADLERIDPDGAAMGRVIGHDSARNSSSPPDRRTNGQVKPAPPRADEKPRWDLERKELFVGDRLVKRYRVHAANQETVLTAFQEEDWPSRIDDPLPPREEIEPKRRLHDAIKNLNRRQMHRLLRFSGDGTGEGILWDRLDPGAVAEIQAKASPDCP